MSVLDIVRDRLRDAGSQRQYTEGEGTIVVHAAPGGFDVSISDTLVVGYDGWHEHFETPEEALECFAFGFTERCRLKVTYRGDVVCQWTVEAFDGDAWVEDSTTGRLFVPFWLPQHTEYRQNIPLQNGAFVWRL